MGFPYRATKLDSDLRVRPSITFTSGRRTKVMIGYDSVFKWEPLIELRIAGAISEVRYKGEVTPYEIGNGIEREPDVLTTKLAPIAPFGGA